MPSRTLEITPLCLDELIAHARQDAPNECCGALGGTLDNEQARMLSTHRIKNVSANPWVYQMDRYELARVLRALPVQGREVIAFYHSHVQSDAYPSDVDITQAQQSGWLGQAYLIISLLDSAHPIVRAFYISPAGKPEEVTLRVK